MTAQTVTHPVSILSREQAKIKPRKTEQAVYIQALISMRRGSERQIADIAGVSFTTVNHVIWGLRTSARVQQAIAKYLGFPSWEVLRQGQSRFLSNFPSALKGGAV